MSEVQEKKTRIRCYRCYRPVDRCFCERIPEVKNRTDVIILQHKRERVHPFNTARIVNLALNKSQLFVDHVPELGQILNQLDLSPNVGLLYPDDDSIPVEDLPSNHPLDQLIVLDGTWHHTKTLFRDIPKLKKLPKYRLSQVKPSQYVIRREPHVQYVSTLEAVVAALKAIEPDTAGLDELVATFVEMINNQLVLPQSDFGARRHHHRQVSRFKNVPKPLREGLDNIVVVYGETAPKSYSLGSDHLIPPVYWVAERLATGECFAETILNDLTLSPTFLGHIELTQDEFRNAISRDEFRLSWNNFLQPKDAIAFYHSNTPKLMREFVGHSHPTFHLKSVGLSLNHRCKSLEEILKSLGVKVDPPKCRGRAGKRLADCAAFAKFLHNHGSLERNE